MNLFIVNDQICLGKPLAICFIIWIFSNTFVTLHYLMILNIDF